MNAVAYCQTPPAMWPRGLWRTSLASAPGGHVSPVTAIAVSVEPTRTISGGYDGHVVCWDASLQRVVWANTFPDLINAVAVADGPGRAAVAVADGFAYILNLTDGRTVSRLGPHGDDVNDIAWNPTGRDEIALVCDADDSSVYVWSDVSTDPSSRIVGKHNHGVFAVVWSPDGDLLATASEDLSVRVWSAAGGLVATLPHPGDVETVSWCPSGRYVATGCDDGRLRLWKTATWTLDETFMEADASVRRVGFSPSGRVLFGASYDGVVRVYDLKSSSLKAAIHSDLQWERACALASDDRLLVGSFGDRPIETSCERPEVGTGVFRTWGLNALSDSLDGALVVGTDCGLVIDIDDGNVILDSRTLITSIATDPSGRLAIADYGGHIFCTENQDTQPLTLVATVRSGPLNSVRWLPDHTLASCGYDGTLRRWTPMGLPLGETVPAHRGPIKSMQWCPVIEGLACASSDNTASMWRLSSNSSFENVATVEADDLVLVNDVAAPLNDRRWIALASRDRHVRLWYPETGRVIRLPRVHDKSVKAIATSPRGDLVVSGSYDGSICFWYLDEADEVTGWRRVYLHGKPGVSAVSVTVSQVRTCGWDGTAARWTHGAELLEHLYPHEVL